MAAWAAGAAAAVVEARQDPPLEAVVRVAGTRWTLARGGDAATGAGGLEPEAVRSWTGWSRPRTRALALETRHQRPQSAQAPIPWRVPAIRRLWWRRVLALHHPLEHSIAWSPGRRWQHAVAQVGHDRRRGAALEA